MSVTATMGVLKFFEKIFLLRMYLAYNMLQKDVQLFAVKVVPTLRLLALT